MKKTYQIPTINIAEIRFCAALLGGSFVNNEDNQPEAGGGNSSSLPDGAPRRRLF